MDNGNFKRIKNGRSRQGKQAYTWSYNCTSCLPDKKIKSCTVCKKALPDIKECFGLKKYTVKSGEVRQCTRSTCIKCQRKRYSDWRRKNQKDPLYRKKLGLWKAQELTDGYIKQILRQNKGTMKSDEYTAEQIEMKRTIILLKRELGVLNR